MSKSLTNTECRKHLAYFTIATPLGALGSFGILTLIGAGDHKDWTSIALLVSVSCEIY